MSHEKWALKIITRRALELKEELRRGIHEENSIKAIFHWRFHFSAYVTTCFVISAFSPAGKGKCESLKE